MLLSALVYTNQMQTAQDVLNASAFAFTTLLTPRLRGLSVVSHSSGHYLSVHVTCACCCAGVISGQHK